nr:hypothetical protein [Tanacetum cinerariifolium]
MFKLDIKPISHRLKNNKDTYEDYLKKTIENTDTIGGLVECARKQNPSEPLLNSACKFTKHVQELLVYVSQTCPSFTKPSEKLVDVTPINKVKKVSISHQTSVAHTPQQNGIVERQNRTLVEAARTISGPGLKSMTLATSILGLVPNPIPQQPCNPPTRNDWDHLFQPMFDEYFNLPQSVVSQVQVATIPRAVDLADSLVSTSTNQDAPSTSIPSTQNKKILQLYLKVLKNPQKTPHINDDPLHETLHEDSTSQGSSSNVWPSHTSFELLGKWTKNNPIANMIEDPSHSVSTRKQLQTDAMWCYFDSFLTSVEPKNYKEAMLEPSWIDSTQDEIHEFERLQIWELVPCPDLVMLIKLKLIFKVKKDECGGLVDPDKPNHVYKLKKALYGLKQAPHAEIFQLYPKLMNQEVDALPSYEEIVSFIKELGHKGDIKSITEVVVALLPKLMTNQKMLNSPAYKTYIAYATGAATPKKEKKFKKPASPCKKRNLVIIEEEEPELAKKVVLSKKPSKKQSTSTKDVDEEEYERISEELYGDVNVRLTDVEHNHKEKGDADMIDVAQIQVEQTQEQIMGVQEECGPKMASIQGERKTRKGQNRNKTGQKQEAWKSP